jgi:hypothetical protein
MEVEELFPDEWVIAFELIWRRFTRPGWIAIIGYPWQTVNYAYSCCCLEDSLPHENVLIVFNFFCEYRKEDAVCLNFNMCDKVYREKLWTTMDIMNRNMQPVSFKILSDALPFFSHSAH